MLLIDVTTMSLSAPAPGQHVELGGGDRPVIRPNLDVRPGPNVDAVIDLEQPLPLAPGSVDGVFSRYALEHVGWRRLPGLLKEIAAALRPGGSLVAVVPDTQAQMRHLLETEDWDDGGSMLFGGQDYGENAHKAFLTPALACRWLLDAGFATVLTCPVGEKGTDMAVQAWMPAAPPAPPAPPPPDRGPTMRVRVGPGIDARFPEGWLVTPKENGLKTDNPAVCFFREGDLTWAEGPRDESFSEGPDGFWHGPPAEPATPAPYRPQDTFGRAYFDGGHLGGGYDLYRDFACHHLTAQHVLAMLPQSAVELGCGRGYVTKRLLDAGVPAWGVDVSPHCLLTHCLPRANFLWMDFTDPGYWRAAFGEARVDLAFSVAVLDHVPEHRLPDLFAALAEYTRRGLHGVNTRPAGADRTRATCRPLDWWNARLPAGHRAVEKDELEAGHYPRALLDGDGASKLNLGSHTQMFHHGWENIDQADLAAFAASQGHRFTRLDLTEGLPHPTGSVSLAYSSHCLEHLTYAQGLALLRSLRRAMKSGGAVRILVPDLATLADRYRDGSLDRFDDLSATCAAARTPAAKLHALGLEHHLSVYDLGTLGNQLTDAGFVRVRQAPHALPPADPSPADLQILRETIDVLPGLSLTVCAAVP